MDFKLWVLPQENLKMKMELSGITEVKLKKKLLRIFLKCFQKFSNLFDFFEEMNEISSKNVNDIIKKIRSEANEGLDCLITIKSIHRYFLIN